MLATVRGLFFVETGVERFHVLKGNLAVGAIPLFSGTLESDRFLAAPPNATAGASGNGAPLDFSYFSEEEQPFVSQLFVKGAERQSLDSFSVDEGDTVTLHDANMN